MPFVICLRCELRFYSGALWSERDSCPLCGEGLEVPRRAIFGPSPNSALPGSAEPPEAGSKGGGLADIRGRRPHRKPAEPDL